MNKFVETRLPEELSKGAVGGPYFDTNVYEMGDGTEHRLMKNNLCQMKYEISYQNLDHKQIEDMIAFFRARFGNIVGFRFKDWCDYFVGNQLIAVGDGLKNNFQLFKQYQSGQESFRRDIYKPIADSLALIVAGEQVKTGFSLDSTTGLLQFSKPPAKNQEIHASFEFDVPVRFQNNYLPIRLDGNNDFSVQKLILTEVKI
jgi:uncharacterized protein (TIGR02217 family)